MPEPFEEQSEVELVRKLQAACEAVEKLLPPECKFLLCVCTEGEQWISTLGDLSDIKTCVRMPDSRQVEKLSERLRFISLDLLRRN